MGQTKTKTAAPFERVLGDRFHRLSPQVRQLHSGRVRQWKGQVTVTRSQNPIAVLFLLLARFPPAMDRATLVLDINSTPDGSERWTRDFAGHITKSKIWVNKTGDVLHERFGAVTCDMVPTEKFDKLHIDLIGASLFGLVPLPRWFVPQSAVTIWQDEAGRYRFDVQASLPGVGQVVRYFGWLRATS